MRIQCVNDPALVIARNAHFKSGAAFFCQRGNIFIFKYTNTVTNSFGAEFLETPPHLGVHPANHPDARALVGRHTGITFYVPGLLHFCGELHGKGVKFLTEPTQMSWGVMAMIADPEGNVYALWEDQLPEDAGPA